MLKSYGRALEISKMLDAISDGKQHFANRHDLTFAAVWEHSVDQYPEKDDPRSDALGNVAHPDRQFQIFLYKQY